MTNPFELQTGSDRMRSPVILIGVILYGVFAAVIMNFYGLMAGMALLMLPFLSVYFIILVKRPAIGLYSAIVLGFVLLGLARYVRGLQVGLFMDGILILTYIVLFINRFRDRIDFTPAKMDITFLAAIWFGYAMFQMVNPEAQSFQAWFTGMRGIALYMMLIVPLVLLLFDTNRKLDIFFIIWGIMSLLVSFKGIWQISFGVDRWEKEWLDGGGYITHILFGKLRAFSFLSDAGQFGANQAYSAVVASIILMVQRNSRLRLFFGTVALLGFYGMFISGTRGAISIPLVGLAAYFVLRKNLPVMIAGFFFLVGVFVFFKYTTIGHNNQHIRRMRTGFDPNDPSLQVRFENQRKLKVYLASRHFGGGIGHAGVKAQRFLPNAFLSNVATDSWYVLIWAEQGIVGLLLHLFILFYIIGKSSYLILFQIRDPNLKMKMTALTSGMLGVMVASYGNAVFGTMPTSILVYTSMALMLNAKKFDSSES